MVKLLHLFLKEFANFKRITPKISALNEDYLECLLNLYDEMNQTPEKKSKISTNLRCFDYVNDPMNTFISYFTIANDEKKNISLLNLSKFMVHPQNFSQM